MGDEKKEYEMISDVQPKNWKLPFAVGGAIQFKNSVFDVQNLRNIKRHGEMLCKIKQMSIEVRRELWAGDLNPACFPDFSRKTEGGLCAERRKGDGFL